MKTLRIILLFFTVSISAFADDYKMDVDADLKIDSGNLFYISRDNPAGEASLSGNLKFTFEYKEFLEAGIEIKNLDELDLYASCELNSYISFSISNIEPEIFLDDILSYNERSFSDSITYQSYKDNYKEQMETVNFQIFKEDIKFPALSYFIQANLNENDLIPNLTTGISYNFSSNLNFIGLAYTSIFSIDDLDDYDGLVNLYYINHDNNLCLGTEIVSGIMFSSDNNETKYWTSFNSEASYKIQLNEDFILSPALRASYHLDDISDAEDYQLESLIGVHLSYADLLQLKLYGGSQYNNTAVNKYTPSVNFEMKLSLEK